MMDSRATFGRAGIHQMAAGAARRQPSEKALVSQIALRSV